MKPRGVMNLKGGMPISKGAAASSSRNQVFKQISASSLQLNASLERKQLAEKLLVQTRATGGPSAYSSQQSVKPRFTKLYKQFRYGGATSNAAQAGGKPSINDDFSQKNFIKTNTAVGEASTIVVADRTPRSIFKKYKDTASSYPT